MYVPAEFDAAGVCRVETLGAAGALCGSGEDEGGGEMGEDENEVHLGRYKLANRAMRLEGCDKILGRSDRLGFDRTWVVGSKHRYPS